MTIKSYKSAVVFCPRDYSHLKRLHSLLNVQSRNQQVFFNNY